MRTHRPIKDARLMPTKYVMLSSFEIIDQGHVDGEPWYVVQVEPKVGRWLCEHDASLWYAHQVGSYGMLNTFDIHESLYTLMTLRWS